MCWGSSVKSKSENLSLPKTDYWSGYVSSKGQLDFSSESLPVMIEAIHNAGGVFRFRAKGGSMSPFIKNGDILSIGVCDFSRLQCGKILAFLHQDNSGEKRVIVHRLIQRGRSGFIFKGDNMAVRDAGPVLSGQILGEVIQVERDGGHIHLGVAGAGRIIALLSRFGILQWLAGALRCLRKVVCRT